MLRWGAERSVNLHFIDPGKPTQNAQIESLNGKIRDELLNAHSFRSIFEARCEAAEWRQDYNEIRPQLRARLPDSEGVRRAISNYPTLTVIGCVKCHLRSPSSQTKNARRFVRFVVAPTGIEPATSGPGRSRALTKTLILSGFRRFTVPADSDQYRGDSAAP